MDQNNQNLMNYLMQIGESLDHYFFMFQEYSMTHEQIQYLKDLPFEYTTEQYLLCLINLLLDRVKDLDERKKLKDIFKKKGSLLQWEFNLLIKEQLNSLQEEQNNIACLKSIKELMIMKMITSNKPQIYFKALRKISNRQYYQQTIQEKDFELIRRIVYSKRVKELILELNKIKFKDQTEQQLNEEIEELLQTLSRPFYVSPKYNSYYGLTCLNGLLIYSEDIVNYEKQGQDSNIYRALLIVTYIHEVFFHLKRIKYCFNDNVLQITPPRYSGQNKERGEVGEFFEYSIFGQTVVLENCKPKLALAILKPENWEDSEFKFSILIKETSHKFIEKEIYGADQIKWRIKIKEPKKQNLGCLLCGQPQKQQNRKY